MLAVAAPAPRLHWVDWLRVLAVLGIVFYHASLPYTGVPWLISNEQFPILPLAALSGVGYLFGMPLVFLVSGAAAAFALRPGRAAPFIRARVTRLLVPMLVGITLLSPLQAYITALSAGRTQESFIRFAPQWLRSIELFLNPRWFGTYGYHLWFLGFLFTYSVVTLPLFAWLRSASGEAAWGWFLAACRRPAGLLLPLLPIAAVNVVFRAAFPWYGDWADFAYWLGFFVLGYLFTGRAGFFPAIRAAWRLNLALVLVCLLQFAVFGVRGDILRWQSHPHYSPGFAYYNVLWTVTAWACVLLTLAIGMDYLNRRNAALDYLNEAVLPVYVLHHPLVVLFAALVVRVPIPATVKFFLTIVPALALTFAVHELGIRRWRVPRALFGLGRRVTGPPATSPVEAVAAPMAEAEVPVAAALYPDQGAARAALAAVDRLRRDRSLGLRSTALVWRDAEGRTDYVRQHVTDARAGAAIGAGIGAASYAVALGALLLALVAGSVHLRQAIAAAVDLFVTGLLYAGSGAALGVVLGAIRNMEAGLPSAELEKIGRELARDQVAAVVRVRPPGVVAAVRALRAAGGRPLPA